jgi:hypothetical protein
MQIVQKITKKKAKTNMKKHESAPNHTKELHQMIQRRQLST